MINIFDKIDSSFYNEVRRRLYTPWFGGLFLLTHVLCLLLTLASSFAGAQSTLLMFINRQDAIWLLLCSCIFLIAIPFQIGNSVVSKLRLRISQPCLCEPRVASRLVWREWFSGVIQAALCSSTLIPYIILQQILGTHELLRELDTFELIFLSGMVSTALTIYSLLCRSHLPRILAFGLLGLIFCLAFFFILDSLKSSGSYFSLKGSIWILVNSILLIGVILEAGATKIASAGDHHALFKRLLALIALGVAFLFTRLGLPAPQMYIVAAFIILSMTLDGLSEPSPIFSTPQHQRFPQYLLSTFFSPGWPSASLFSLLIFLISLKVLRWEHLIQKPELALIFAVLFAAVIWPAALIRFFLPKSPHFPVLYFSFQMVSLLAPLVHWLASQSSGTLWDVLISLFPTAIFFFHPTLIAAGILPAGFDIYLWISTILCCLSLFLLCAKAIVLKLEKNKV